VEAGWEGSEEGMVGDRGWCVREGGDGELERCDELD
jgi:hypothetical protein